MQQHITDYENYTNRETRLGDLQGYRLCRIVTECLISLGFHARKKWYKNRERTFKSRFSAERKLKHAVQKL